MFTVTSNSNKGILKNYKIAKCLKLHHVDFNMSTGYYMFGWVMTVLQVYHRGRLVEDVEPR